MNKTEQKYSCDVVQDLLPLYQDNVCSDATKIIVEEHLAECIPCTEVANKLKDTYLDDHLGQEKNQVLNTHAKKEKKRAYLVGIFTAGILMVPLIICLICNLAIGHGLDWFFIVLASLLVFASFTVVPLVVSSHRGLWTLGSFVFSLLLLLLIICIYTQGHWFFLATIPIVLGLSIVFMPFVVYAIPLPKFLLHSKGLLVMLWDTAWLYAVIIISGMHSSAPHYWDYSLKITSVCVLVPWIVFIIARYLKVHPFIKAGLNTAFIGVSLTFMSNIISRILNEPRQFTLQDANLWHWNPRIIEANVNLIVLLSAVLIGLLLIFIGLFLQLRNKK